MLLVQPVYKGQLGQQVLDQPGQLVQQEHQEMMELPVQLVYKGQLVPQVLDQPGQLVQQERLA